MRLKKLTSDDELYQFTTLFVKACQVWQHIPVHRLAYEYFAALLRQDNYELWLLYDDTNVLVGFMDMGHSNSPVMPFRRAWCQFIYVESHVSALPLMMAFKRYAFAHEADTIDVSCKHGMEARWLQHGFEIVNVTLRGPKTWEIQLQP